MEGDNRMDDKLEQMQSGPAPENAPPEEAREWLTRLQKIKK